MPCPSNRHQNHSMVWTRLAPAAVRPGERGSAMWARALRGATRLARHGPVNRSGWRPLRALSGLTGLPGAKTILEENVADSVFMVKSLVGPYVWAGAGGLVVWGIKGTGGEVGRRSGKMSEDCTSRGEDCRGWRSAGDLCLDPLVCSHRCVGRLGTYASLKGDPAFGQTRWLQFTI